MKPTNKRYKIETIKDLVNLHPDQLQRWFVDFSEAHKITHILNKQIDDCVKMTEFTWIDDGKNDGHMMFKSKDSEDVVFWGDIK